MTREPQSTQDDDPTDVFAGDNPFDLARDWLADAVKSEPNDPNAMALATSDQTGLPDVRMVLLKDILNDGFVFYTNYESAKGQQLSDNAQAAGVLHWKSLRRQIRFRGSVTRYDGPEADEYFASRSLKSRLGAWSSKQSQPISNRAVLLAEVAKQTAIHGSNPPRPPFWGGYLIQPTSVEFWSDGAFRLHDRFQWTIHNAKWSAIRLSP